MNSTALHPRSSPQHWVISTTVMGHKFHMYVGLFNSHGLVYQTHIFVRVLVQVNIKKWLHKWRLVMIWRVANVNKQNRGLRNHCTEREITALWHLGTNNWDELKTLVICVVTWSGVEVWPQIQPEWCPLLAPQPHLCLLNTRVLESQINQMHRNIVRTWQLYPEMLCSLIMTIS